MMRILLGLVFSAIAGLTHAQSTLQVTLKDTAQMRIVRQYIARNELHRGLKKESAVIKLSFMYDDAHPTAPKWFIGATSRKDNITDRMPALLSRLDGYRIAIYFVFGVDSFMTYSPEHIAEVSKFLLPGLEDKPEFEVQVMDIRKPGGVIDRRTVATDPRPAERYEPWLAVFPEKGVASWKIIDEIILDKGIVLKQEIIRPTK